MQGGDGTVAAVERIRRRVRYDAPGFAGAIDAFLQEHLGDARRPTPFAGREADIAALNAWLTDETASDRLLIAAPAGRGKSALLAHWIVQLPSDWSVVFVAAGGSRRTTHPAAFCHGLAARIADALGDADLRLAPPGEAVAHYRNEIRRLLLTFNPAAHDRIVVVVDGLDEIDRGRIIRDLFPDAPPPGLRFLVAANLTHDAPTPDAWRQRLDWPEDGQSHDLPPLDATAIAATPDIVDDVARLTGGEPFLINLYAGGDDERDVTQPGDLAAMPPGLSGFFDRWFADRRRPRSRDWANDRAFLTTAALIGQAKAPLTHRALSSLLTASDETGSTSIDDLLTPLRPFLAKDGIAFTHPRLADFFGGCRRLSPDRLRYLDDDIVANARQAYLRWGDEALESISKGDVTVDHAYLLDHYLDHLIEAEASVADLMRLTGDGWRRARLAQDHGERDFAFDVERIRRYIAGRPDGWAATGLPNHVSAQMRCALISSSIGSLGTEIRPAVIRRAVETSQLTIGGALDLISLMETDRSRLYALVELAAVADTEDADRLLNATRDDGDDEGWSQVLAELATKLPIERRGPMVQQAFNLALDIADPKDRAVTLAALAPHLPAEQRDSALRQAIEATANIKKGHSALEALAALASKLTADRFEQAWSTALNIENDFYRARALAKLAAQAPAPKHASALREALQAARDVKDVRLRALALGRPAPDWTPEFVLEAFEVLREIGYARIDTEAPALLAPFAPDDQREALVRESFHAARDKLPDFSKAQALAALAPHLPDDLLMQGIKAARGIYEVDARSIALGALAWRLPDDERVALLREALVAAGETDLEYDRSWALSDLAPHLPPMLVPEVLAAARSIDDSYTAIKALAKLVRHLSAGQRDGVLRLAMDSAHRDGRTFVLRTALAKLFPYLSTQDYNALLTRALTAVERFPDEDLRTEALVELAPHVSSELLPRALAMARDVGDEEARTDALAALAVHMPTGERRAVLKKTIQVVADLQRQELVPLWLTDLAPHLPPDLLQQALRLARRIGRASARAKTLVRLADRLPADEKDAVLREALETARGIESALARAETLVALAPKLPRAQLTEVVKAAQAIVDDEERADALTTLSAMLPANERDELLHEALDATWAMEEDSAQCWMLAALAPLLTAEHLRRALSIARGIGGAWERAKALTALAPSLEPARRSTVLA